MVILVLTINFCLGGKKKDGRKWYWRYWKQKLLIEVKELEWRILLTSSVKLLTLWKSHPDRVNTRGINYVGNCTKIELTLATSCQKYQKQIKTQKMSWSFSQLPLGKKAREIPLSPFFNTQKAPDELMHIAPCNREGVEKKRPQVLKASAFSSIGFYGLEMGEVVC